MKYRVQVFAAYWVETTHVVEVEAQGIEEARRKAEASEPPKFTPSKIARVAFRAMGAENCEPQREQVPC